MNTEYDFNYEGVIEEYNRRIISKRKKIAKVLNILLIIYLVIMTLVYLVFPEVLDNSNSKTTYYVIGGVIGIPLLLGSLLNQLVTSEKPFYNYVIREIVKNINTNNQTYEYLAYPRKKDNVNKIGGLFSRSATINIKNQIKGKTKSDNDFSYYNMRLYTTDGKNHYILFNGMYFVIKYPIGKVFQIRSHSRPKLRDTKFIKSDEVDGLKLFTVKDDPTSVIDKKFIETLLYIKNKYKAKKIYLSAVNDQIHLAIESTESVKKPRVINLDTLTETVNKVNNIINIPNEVIDKLN